MIALPITLPTLRVAWLYVPSLPLSHDEYLAMNDSLQMMRDGLLVQRDDGLLTEDGFGSTWGPCPNCNVKMQVVRPGKAVCPVCDSNPPTATERVDKTP